MLLGATNEPGGFYDSEYLRSIVDMSGKMFLKRFKISKIRFKISKKSTCSSLIIRHVTTFAVRAPLPLEQGLRLNQ